MRRLVLLIHFLVSDEIDSTENLLAMNGKDEDVKVRGRTVGDFYPCVVQGYTWSQAQPPLGGQLGLLTKDHHS